jgi:hypothetical protein
MNNLILKHGDEVILTRNIHKHRYDSSLGRTVAIDAPYEKYGIFIEMSGKRARCEYRTSIGKTTGLFTLDQIRKKNA